MPNLATNQRYKVKQAVRALDAGGIIAYPTETIYGLGCDPLSLLAVARLLILKRRSVSKGLIVIAAEIQTLQTYVDFTAAPDMQQILKTWPGPTTWIVPAQPWVPQYLRGKHQTLAVRISSHPIAQALCQRWGGAIVSTSANISGRAVVRNSLQLQHQFGCKVDFIIPGKAGPCQAPSQIRDAVTGKILRHRK